MDGDFVIFNKNLALDDTATDIIFKKGKKYEILDENKDFIFVNSKPNTNECSQIPKSELGKLYKYV